MKTKTWKTPKGTELTLMDLKGKDYLPAAQRLVWFREECPQHQVRTEIVQLSEKHALVKAAIADEKGDLLATAHKWQDKSGFANYVEKAETGAVSRALAMCGFGTQFAEDDFDEGDDLSDAPQSRKPAATAGVQAAIKVAAVPPKKALEDKLFGPSHSCGNRMIKSKYGNDWWCGQCKENVPQQPALVEDKPKPLAAKPAVSKPADDLTFDDVPF